MAGKLGIYAGREKTVSLTWRQGSSPSSPPVDCTGASCSVFSSTLPPNAVIVAAVNPSQGQYSLTFVGIKTRSLRSGNTYHLCVALTWPAPNQGSSPDPVMVEVYVR